VEKFLSRDREKRWSLVNIPSVIAYYSESVIVLSLYFDKIATYYRLKPSVTFLLLMHPFNGLLSRTTWVSRYQKGKTSLDSNET